MLEIISDSQTCLDALESLMLDRNTDQQWKILLE
jgi:ribonuclease HI